MWESLGSNYLEAATKALPLHRALLFALGFLFSGIVLTHEYKSIFESIANLKILDAISLHTGILSQSTIANCLWGFATTISGLAISRITLRLIFNYGNKISSIKKKIAAAHADTPFKNKTPTISEKKEAIEFIDSSLNEIKGKIQSLNAAAELFAGSFIAFIVASYWGNIIDFGIGVFFFVALIATQAKSLLVFLNEYIGGAITRSQLLGKSPPDLPKLR